MQDIIKNHFGLKKIPFSKQISVNELYLTEEIKECCARLEFAVENEDIAFIYGDVGCGKTTALRYFANQINPNGFKVVYIPTDPINFGEICKYILAGLGLVVPYAKNKAIRELKKYISDLHKDKGIKPIIIIDEVQELRVECLKSLKNLVNFDMDSNNRMLLILCGQKDFLSTLEMEVLTCLKRRIRISYEMKDLSLDNTNKYIKHNLNIAGLSRPIFPDEVISQLYSITKGNISEINKLCFNMINMAVAESKDIMELSLLERSYQF